MSTSTSFLRRAQVCDAVRVRLIEIGEAVKAINPDLLAEFESLRVRHMYTVLASSPALGAWSKLGDRGIVVRGGAKLRSDVEVAA